MAKRIPDQADGLRKLAGLDGLQVISILSGRHGAGKTVAATNLASALTRAGRVVKVVASPKAGRTAIQPGMRERLMEDSAPDIILVDTPSGGTSDYPDIERTEIVIVIQPDPESITSGYSLLKQLSVKYGIDSFHVLLNKSANPEGGAAIARNFSDAAGRFLGVSVHYLGHIPHDPQLEQATRLKKSVVDAFPIAESARQFRKMADKLVCMPRLSSLGEMGEAMQRVVMSAAG